MSSSFPSTSYSSISSSTTTTSASIPSSVFTPVSHSTPSPPSSSIPALVTAASHLHTLSSGAVASIAVAAILLCICAGVVLLFHLRRRHLQSRLRLPDAEVNRRGRTISPFRLLVEDSSLGSANATDADSDARSISARTIARQRLETQLRAAAEKMVELEELAEGVTASDTNAGDGGGAEGREELVSPARASASPPEDLKAELRAAREQINMLVARMNAMDAAWGMGMGGEPPPEYA